MASLKFLLKMGKKGDRSDELILPQPKITIPELKIKKSNKVNINLNVLVMYTFFNIKIHSPVNRRKSRDNQFFAITESRRNIFS